MNDKRFGRPAVCARCGDHYLAKRNAAYCSDRCRFLSWRSQKAKHMRQYRSKRASSVAGVVQP